MKFIRLLLVLFILAQSCTEVVAQDFKKPVDYLSYIGGEYGKIAKEQWGYSSAVAHGKRAKLVEKRRKDLLLAINASKRNVSRMPSINKSTAFRDSIVSYLRLTYNLINNDYAKIVNMEEVAEQSYDLMEAYMLAKELATEKAAQASDMVSIEQDRFVVENKIRIIQGEESRLGKKMREAGVVFKYYNEVYLIFFKAHKQNEYLSDALSKGDINSLEQNRNAMLNYAKEGQDKIKQYVRFSGDESLSAACRDVLGYYVDKAQNKVPVLINYFTVKDKFEKVKTSFDNIKTADRTQQNIDLYNASIGEINTETDRYNKLNVKLHEAEKKMIDNWNKKSDAFLDSHVAR